jgi:hypothetical protein
MAASRAVRPFGDRIIDELAYLLQLAPHYDLDRLSAARSRDPVVGRDFTASTRSDNRESLAQRAKRTPVAPLTQMVVVRSRGAQKAV